MCSNAAARPTAGNRDVEIQAHSSYKQYVMLFATIISIHIVSGADPGIFDGMGEGGGSKFYSVCWNFLIANNFYPTSS